VETEKEKMQRKRQKKKKNTEIALQNSELSRNIGFPVETEGCGIIVEK